jgi:hypothetical protein
METKYGIILDNNSNIELELEDDSYNLDIEESINPGEPSGGQNYEVLRNKPSINSVELVGNLTTEDLKLDYNSIPNKPTINSKLIQGNITLEDLGLGVSDIASINKLFN